MAKLVALPSKLCACETKPITHTLGNGQPGVGFQPVATEPALCAGHVLSSPRSHTRMHGLVNLLGGRKWCCSSSNVSFELNGNWQLRPRVLRTSHCLCTSPFSQVIQRSQNAGIVNQMLKMSTGFMSRCRFQRITF